jgi:hypothetical protein
MKILFCTVNYTIRVKFKHKDKDELVSYWRESYGVFGLWSHSMLHKVMHYKFIPSILVESTHFSCIY